MSTIPYDDKSQNSLFEISFTLPRRFSKLSNINYRIAQNARLSQLFAVATIFVASGWIISIALSDIQWTTVLSIVGVIMTMLTSFYYISGLSFSSSEFSSTSHYVSLSCMVAGIAWLAILLFHPLSATAVSDHTLRFLVLFVASLVLGFLSYTYPIERQERQIYLARVIELVFSMRANYVNAEDKDGALSEAERQGLNSVMNVLQSTSIAQERLRWVLPVVISFLLSLLVFLSIGVN